MSKRNADSPYDQLTSVFRFVKDSWFLDINVALPAHVLEYDNTTRRVQVEPSIRIVMTDKSEVRRPPIVDVPVLWPGSKRYIVHAPLERGDPVMLLVSQRGMTEFKRAFRLSSPAIDPGILNFRDSVAIPAFGEIEITPSDNDALVMQSRDGRQYMAINDDGNINVRCTGEFRVDASEARIVTSAGTAHFP